MSAEQRDALAREETLVVTLVCDECGFTYEGEVFEGEPDECVMCNSLNVSRQTGVEA